MLPIISATMKITKMRRVADVEDCTLFRKSSALTNRADTGVGRDLETEDADDGSLRAVRSGCGNRSSVGAGTL